MYSYHYINYIKNTAMYYGLFFLNSRKQVQLSISWKLSPNNSYATLSKIFGKKLFQGNYFL